MANTGRTFCGDLQILSAATNTLVCDVVYLVPVPNKRVRRDFRNVPQYLQPDTLDPGHGGYTAAEISAFQKGLLIEVVDRIQFDGTGVSATDKNTLKTKVKAKFDALVQEQIDKAPGNGFIGMSYDAATNTWTDFPQLDP